MKRITTKAIVLKRINFKEADKILTLLSADHGKIRVIAKGVRKLKSKLAGGLELLSISDVTYIVGKSDIYTVVSSRFDEHYGNIVKDINRTMLAYELIRRVDKISEDHAGQEFFIIPKSALEGLNNTQDRSLIELWFNLQLLKLTGHSPNFDTQMDGKKLDIQVSYAFDVDDMCFRPTKSRAVAQNQIKLLRLASSVKTPSLLNKLDNVQEYLDGSVELSQILVKKQFNL